MKRFMVLGFALGLALLVAEAAFAHGGSYNGPGGSVPPSAQPPGSPTPPPSPTPTPGPSPTPSPTPGPSASPTPTPTPGAAPFGSPGASIGARPAGGVSGATTARRNAGGASTSFEDWDFWWGFNKDSYLNLKEHLFRQRFESETAEFFFGRRTKRVARDTSRPTREFVRVHLIPRLVQALDAQHPDIRDSACIAIGKVGGASEIPHLRRMIRDDVRSVREGAVIGLGLLKAKESIPALAAILRADREGARLRGGREPEYRLRSFAAIGLGLCGDNEKEEVRSLLMRISSDRRLNRNITVNAAIGLGLLQGDATYLKKTAKHLEDLATESGRNDDWVRAHALVALGRLTQRNGLSPDPATVNTVTRLARRDRSNHVRRSAIIALGSLIKNPEDHPNAIKVLRTATVRARDNQSRNFAAIALGQIGGDAAFKTLRDGVLRHRNQRGAYAALGLGILCEKLIRADTETGAQQRLSGLSAIRTAFAKTRDPQVRGGLAIALGIARDHGAGEVLLATMKKTRDVSLRGYLAIALGMVNYTDAVDYLTRVLNGSTNLPLLKQQVAIGLGLMGTREIIRPLIAAMKTARTTYAKGSITKALGLIGDRTAIRPLAALLIAKQENALTRGFACVALGSIGEDEHVPVLSSIAANHNYLASTESLSELMDIL